MVCHITCGFHKINVNVWFIWISYSKHVVLKNHMVHMDFIQQACGFEKPYGFIFWHVFHMVPYGKKNACFSYKNRMDFFHRDVYI